MANYGFGITAAQINKLLGSEWTEDVRINCYMAAAIADLPDTKAYAKFVSLLNTLGIKSAAHLKVAKDQYVDTFTFGGEAVAKMTEDDMRKFVASHLWKDQKPETTYVMLAAVKGNDLLTLYNKYATASDTQKFVMHRICIGQNTVYRICADNTEVASIVAEALRYLTKEK